MVGKLSDNTKMSGSRIPVLYCWKHGVGHPWSTPNDELRKSIQAMAGEHREFDIGEPGVVGNLLEPVLISNVCEVLGIDQVQQSPPVIKLEDFEVSCDGIAVIDEPLVIESSSLINIVGADQITLEGTIPIECKVTTAPPTDEIPLYRGPIQLQAQMMATGASAGIIITLHRGIERRITIMRADPDIQAEIADICVDFRNRVFDHDYYPPVNVDDAVIAPAEKNEIPVELNGLENDIYHLELLRDHRRQLNEEVEELEVKIMTAMGDATLGQAGPYRVEWPVRNYKAQPERIVAAKEARVIRLKSLVVKSTI
jgi:hypothetical protein